MCSCHEEEQGTRQAIRCSPFDYGDEKASLSRKKNTRRVVVRRRAVREKSESCVSLCLSHSGIFWQDSFLCIFLEEKEPRSRRDCLFQEVHCFLTSLLFYPLCLLFCESSSYRKREREREKGESCTRHASLSRALYLCSSSSPLLTISTGRQELRA